MQKHKNMSVQPFHYMFRTPDVRTLVMYTLLSQKRTCLLAAVSSFIIIIIIMYSQRCQHNRCKWFYVGTEVEADNGSSLPPSWRRRSSELPDPAANRRCRNGHRTAGIITHNIVTLRIANAVARATRNAKP